MQVGTIKVLSPRGFGFIQMKSGPDIFFHYAVVEGKDFDSLTVGESVEYEIDPNSDKGPRAACVHRLANARLAA